MKVLLLVLSLVLFCVCWLIMDYMFGDRVVVEILRDVNDKLGRYKKC
jgi:hypothetical protein